MLFLYKVKSKSKYIVLCILIFFLMLLLAFIIYQRYHRYQPLWTLEQQETTPFLNMRGLSSAGRYSLIEIVYTERKKDGAFQQNEQCILLNNETLKKEIIVGDQTDKCRYPQFFSKDKKFAYLMMDKEEKFSLFVKEIPTGKTIKVKELEPETKSYLFSPDGKSVLYLQAEAEKNDEDRMTLGTKQSVKKIYLQKVNEHMQPFGNPKLLTPTPLDKYASEFPAHAWSPDSQRVVFITTKTNPMSVDEKTVYLFNTYQNKLKKIIGGIETFENFYFSPNGEFLAFSLTPYNLSDERGQRYVYIFNVVNNNAIKIKVSDRLDIIGWTKNGKALIATQQKGTVTQLCSLNIRTKEIKIIPLPDHITLVAQEYISSDQNHIGFVGENFYHPGEVYVSALEPLEPKKVTSLNASIDLSQLKAETIKWKSFDGQDIEGILVYPQAYQKDQKVPLIVSLHGGLGGIAVEQFIGDTWLSLASPAVFASLGYAFLTVNYRGSSGYGAKFIELARQDTGEGSYKDIITGIDYLIEKRIADPHQLFIQGHSYGGFLTAWAIGHTHRFKAAIVASGFVDWISTEGAESKPMLVQDEIGIPYWDNYALWWKISPLSYVQNVVTPTLILHGKKDTQVDITQSKQLHQALQERKVPLRTVYYIDEGHGFDNVTTDAMNEMIEWFEKFRK